MYCDCATLSRDQAALFTIVISESSPLTSQRCSSFSNDMDHVVSTSSLVTSEFYKMPSEHCLMACHGLSSPSTRWLCSRWWLSTRSPRASSESRGTAERLCHDELHLEVIRQQSIDVILKICGLRAQHFCRWTPVPLIMPGVPSNRACEGCRKRHLKVCASVSISVETQD